MTTASTNDIPSTTAPRRPESSRVCYVERSFALILLVMLLPVLTILFVLVRGTSRGRFIFKQERMGYGVQPFRVYKIRTMSVGSEKRTALGTTTNGAGVTKIGRLLRLLKLDEIPQLVNIIRGEMRFVGPRPIPLALDAELRKHLPHFKQRYQCHPGITSLAQVCVKDNQLNDRLVTDWEQRLSAELHYLRHRGPFYDMFVVVFTFLYMIKKAVIK